MGETLMTTTVAVGDDGSVRFSGELADMIGAFVESIRATAHEAGKRDGIAEERARCAAAVQALYDATPHKRHEDGTLNFEYDSGFDQGREDGLEDALTAITEISNHDSRNANAETAP